MLLAVPSVSLRGDSPHWMTCRSTLLALPLLPVKSPPAARAASRAGERETEGGGAAAMMLRGRVSGRLLPAGAMQGLRAGFTGSVKLPAAPAAAAEAALRRWETTVMAGPQ